MEVATYNRKAKNEVREKLFNIFPKNVKNVLELPSDEMLSVHEGFKQRVYNKNTRFVFPECKINKAIAIEAKSKKLGLDASVFHGWLHKLTDLRRRSKTPLQVAYLDTCSTPNIPILCWIEANITACNWWEHGGVIAICLQDVPRGSQSWFDSFWKVAKYDSFASAADRMIRCSLWKYRVRELDFFQYHDYTSTGRPRPNMNVFVYQNLGLDTSSLAEQRRETLYKAIGEHYAQN